MMYTPLSSPRTNPTKAATVQAIVNAAELSEPQKIEKLLELELDLRQILVAAEEGMAHGEDPNHMGEDDPGVALRRVQDALAELGAEPDSTAPTKTGR